MTKDEFGALAHGKVFERDYRGRKIELSTIDKTDAGLLKLMDGVIGYVSGKALVVIHCLWEASGHVAKSQHYLGKACDFHLEPVGRMSFVEQIGLVEEALENLNATYRVGLGIYPTWNHRGFHVDTRGTRARWGYLGKEPVAFETALKYAIEKGL